MKDRIFVLTCIYIVMILVWAVCSVTLIAAYDMKFFDKVIMAIPMLFMMIFYFIARYYV